MIHSLIKSVSKNKLNHVEYLTLKSFRTDKHD